MTRILLALKTALAFIGGIVVLLWVLAAFSETTMFYLAFGPKETIGQRCQGVKQCK